MVPLPHRHYYILHHELDPRKKTQPRTPLALRPLPSQPFFLPLLRVLSIMDRIYIIQNAINYILVTKKRIQKTHCKTFFHS